MPDRRAHLVGDAGNVVAVQLFQELVAGQKLRQRAVADAVKLHLGSVHVDGDDRDAAARAGGQHEAVAGEASRRRAVLHIDRQHHRCGGDLAYGRRQAGAEGHFIVLAVFEPFDADLLVLGLDTLGRRVVDGDKLRIVDAGLDQFLGKLRADARRAGVGIDRMVDDAEAFARLQIGIVGLDGGRTHQSETGFVGLQGRPIEVAAIEAGTDQRQHFGAHFGGAQQLVGVEAGGGGVYRQIVGFRGVGRRLYGERFACQCEPELAVVGQHRNRGFVFLHGGAVIACQGGLFGRRPQRRHPFGGLGIGRIGELVAVLLGLIGHPAREEGEFRRCADIGVAIDVDDLAGDRPAERLQRIIV